MVEVNRMVVRCAEELVLFRDDAPWVASLVRDNREYEIVADARRIPTDWGYLLATSLKVDKVR